MSSSKKDRNYKAYEMLSRAIASLDLIDVYQEQAMDDAARIWAVKEFKLSKKHKETAYESWKKHTLPLYFGKRNKRKR